VIVVPILAPIIIPIDCLSVNNPALTSPIARTVVPLLLWINPVTIAPVKTPRSGVLVPFSRITLNRSPATACNPSDIDLIPKRKSPSPPKKLNNTVVKSISANLSFLIYLDISDLLIFIFANCNLKTFLFEL